VGAIIVTGADVSVFPFLVTRSFFSHAHTRFSSPPRSRFSALLSGLRGARAPNTPARRRDGAARSARSPARSSGTTASGAMQWAVRSSARLRAQLRAVRSATASINERGTLYYGYPAERRYRAVRGRCANRRRPAPAETIPGSASCQCGLAAPATGSTTTAAIRGTAATGKFRRLTRTLMWRHTGRIVETVTVYVPELLAVMHQFRQRRASTALSVRDQTRASAFHLECEGADIIRQQVWRFPVPGSVPPARHVGPAFSG